MINNILRWLVRLLSLLWEALRDALPTLRELIQRLLVLLRRSKHRQGLSERDRRRARTTCVPINDPAYKRPDPTIYSQTYLMGLGLAVTWDNPDIQLYEGGTPVTSSQLKADTDYEIVARIWNNSTEAPVVGLPVHFTYMSFGVGTQNHGIGDTQVNLGVKGGANHPAFAHMLWHTPAAAGHYCIRVRLDWYDDANPNNNLGQENTNVAEAHSPAEFAFTLRNPTRERLRYRFEVNAYAIPRQRPCPDGDSGRPGDQPTTGMVPANHDPQNYPLPQGWSVAFNPATPELAPDEEQTVQVVVTPPDGFVGRQPVNVNAFNRYGLAGGLTLYVEGA